MRIKHCEKCHSQLTKDGKHYHLTECVENQIQIMRKALNKIRKKGGRFTSAVAVTALIRAGFNEDIE